VIATKDIHLLLNHNSSMLVAGSWKLPRDRERRPLIISTYGAEAFRADFVVLNINRLPILCHDKFRLLRGDAVAASSSKGHWFLYSLSQDERNKEDKQ